MQRVLTACKLGLIAAVIGCSAPQVVPIGALSAGDTPEKVEHVMGKPNQRVVRQMPQLSVEIWSYERAYRLFSVDDCPNFIEHKLTVNGHDVEGRQCKERARVVFSGGKVVAFEFAEGSTY